MSLFPHVITILAWLFKKHNWWCSVGEWYFIKSSQGYYHGCLKTHDGCWDCASATAWFKVGRTTHVLSQTSLWWVNYYILRWFLIKITQETSTYTIVYNKLTNTQLVLLYATKNNKYNFPVISSHLTSLYRGTPRTSSNPINTLVAFAESLLTTSLLPTTQFCNCLVLLCDGFIWWLEFITQFSNLPLIIIHIIWIIIIK